MGVWAEIGNWDLGILLGILRDFSDWVRDSIIVMYLLLSRDNWVIGSSLCLRVAISLFAESSLCFRPMFAESSLWMLASWVVRVDIVLSWDFGFLWLLSIWVFKPMMVCCWF